MLRQLFLAAFAGSVILSLGAQAQPKDITGAPNGAYSLDVAHSQVLFSISHLELTDYHGRFDKVSGTLNLDANEPEKSATSITIDMNSLDTPSAELNDILKGSSVFSASQFPAATFKSTAVTRTGADTGRIAGDLTIKGVTKPVTLDVVFNGTKRNPLKGDFILGFRAKTTIKRSDFGLTNTIWSSFVGDDVNLEIEALFEQEKE